MGPEMSVFISERADCVCPHRVRVPEPLAGLFGTKSEWLGPGQTFSQPGP